MISNLKKPSRAIPVAGIWVHRSPVWNILSWREQNRGRLRNREKAPLLSLNYCKVFRGHRYHFMGGTEAQLGDFPRDTPQQNSCTLRETADPLYPSSAPCKAVLKSRLRVLIQRVSNRCFSASRTHGRCCAAYHVLNNRLITGRGLEQQDSD